MELEEEARVIEKQAFRARANLRKVALYCQGKGMDELRARSKAIYFRKECTATEKTTVARDRATDGVASRLEVGARAERGPCGNYLRVDGVGARRRALHAIDATRSSLSRRAESGLACLQTRTRPPRDTLDRIQRAAPRETAN